MMKWRTMVCTLACVSLAVGLSLQLAVGLQIPQYQVAEQRTKGESPWVHFTFDREAVAVQGVGKLGKIEVEGCSLVPGLIGDAVRFEPEKKGYLRASAQEFPIEEGTLSLWVALNQDYGDDRWHSFFSMNRGDIDVVKLAKADRAAACVIRLLWTGGKTQRTIDTEMVYNNTATQWAAGEWHHLTCTWKTGADAILYVDGLEAGRAADLPALTQRPDFFALGYDTVNGTTAGCTLDEVRIFQRALRRSEVWNLAAQAEEREQAVRAKLSRIPDEFTFAIISDAHIGWYPNLARKFDRAVKMLNKLKPAFVVLLGDLVNSGFMGGETADVEYSLAALLASRLEPVVVPVVGNHEVPTDDPDDPSRVLFLNMGKQLKTFGRYYYSFDCGKWHFVVLDTGWDGIFGEAQLDWLRTDMAKDARRPKMCFMHIHMVPIGEGWLDSAEATVKDKGRESLPRIFRESSVEWMFMGHAHPTLDRSWEHRVRIGDVHFVHVPSLGLDLCGADRGVGGFLLVHVRGDKVAGSEFVYLSGKVVPEPAPETYKPFDNSSGWFKQTGE